MKDINISVVVPVYNAEKYLAQCLDSICNQTLQNIEMILVDDSSTDNSLAILQAYAKKDCRVTVVENEHIGEGAASARNKGLQLAKGKYLSFLDADDFFALDMLQKVYDKAEATDADIVLYDGMYYDHTTDAIVDTTSILDHAKLPDKAVFSYKDTPDTLFLCGAPVPWLKLFKRELIETENLRFQPVYYTDDVAFVLGALATAKKIAVVPEKFVHYRINQDAAQTTNKATSPLSIVKACLAVKDFLKEKGLFDVLQNAYANYAIKDIAFGLNTLNTAESFLSLYTALNETYLDELELATSLTNNILHFDAKQWIAKIKANDAVAYGFYSDGFHRDALFFRYSSARQFPTDCIPKHARVILYGAGKVGKSLYVQNIMGNYCDIVAWVDKSHEGKPFPVEGLSVLEEKKNEMDYVLVAIENPVTAKKVEVYLLGIGIPKECILLYE